MTEAAVVVRQLLLSVNVSSDVVVSPENGVSMELILCPRTAHLVSNLGTIRVNVCIGMQAGRDISVMGFDNEMISDYMTPRLSTMKIELGTIGKKAVELLFDKMADKPVESQIKVPCTLIERKSVISNTLND